MIRASHHSQLIPDGRRIGHSQAVLLAAALASMAISLALTILLGRRLTPDGFGFIALVGAVLALARDLTDLGSASVAAAAIAADPAAERRIVEELLGLRLVLAGLCAMACCGLAVSRDDPAQSLVLAAAAVTILLFHLNAYNAVFLVRQALGGATLLSATAQLTVLGSSLLLQNAPAAVFAVLFVARDAAVALGLRALAVRSLGFRPWPRLPRRGASLLMRRSALFGLAALCFSLTIQGSPLLVGLMLPPADLGAFAAAFRPMAPLMTMPGLIVTPLVPALAALAVSDRPAFAARSAATVQATIGIGAIIAVAGCDLAHPALGLVYGGRFLTGPLSAVPSLQCLAIALGGICALAGASVVLLATGRVGTILRLAASCLAVAGGLTLALVPRIGFTGAAAGMAVATVTVGCAALMLAMRQGAAPVSRIQAVGPLLPAAALAFVTHLLPSATLWHLAGGIVATLAGLAATWGVVAAGHRLRVA